MSKGIDWPGLLKWSVQYSDGTGPTTPMSAERMKFLEIAIREAMEMYEDPNDVVKEAAKKLQESKLNDGDALSALLLIEKCTDEAPEISRNLHKLGALSVLINKCSDSNSELSEKALQILSFALQHNPAVQREAYKLGYLKVLLSGSPTAFASSPTRLGALSGLIRHEVEMEKEFLQSNGLEILSLCLNSDNLRVQLKALTLTRHLLEERTNHEMQNCGDIPLVIYELFNKNDNTKGLQFNEALAAVVLMFLTHRKDSLIQCHLPNDPKRTVLDGLLSAINNRICFLKSSDQSEQSQQELQILDEAIHRIAVVDT